jgi:porphobilinogen synthase
MVRETEVSLTSLMYPLFMVDGINKQIPINSMPGINRWSVDLLLKEIETCLKLGVKSFVLFPAVEDALKDQFATHSYDSSNFYLRAIREIKKQFPEACLMSDVAMDPYSSDGHDGCNCANTV